MADRLDPSAFRRNLDAVAAQRWAEVDGAASLMASGTPERLTADSTAIDREFFAYYRMPRGSHPRATTAFLRTSHAPMALGSAFDHLDWISPRPLLFVTGDRAHSRAFSEQAFRLAADPKELLVVPGVGHVDLYDRVDLITFDGLDAFFRTHLA